MTVMLQRSTIYDKLKKRAKNVNKMLTTGFPVQIGRSFKTMFFKNTNNKENRKSPPILKSPSEGSKVRFDQSLLLIGLRSNWDLQMHKKIQASDHFPYLLRR